MRTLFFISFFVTFTAHADRFPAINYGLTPETGYLEAVTQDETCDPATNVSLRKAYGSLMTILKCDGSRIGWIERTVTAPQLALDDWSQDDPYDMIIKDGFVDQFGNEGTNVYTCGESRAEELAEFPEVTPATNPVVTFKAMQALREQGKSMTVQLFFNEHVYSGKCIGGVREKI